MSVLIYFLLFLTLGTSVKQIAKTILASKQIPLLMYGGEVMCATAGGQISQLTLSSHNFTQFSVVDRDKSILETNFKKHLNLMRFPVAMKACQSINNKECWENLGVEVMKYLDLDMAIRVYKQLDDAAMVDALQNIWEIEDCKLLAGYIALFLNDFDQAQSWFLKSSRPLAALEMRRDLLQWDQALQLAKKMAPEQIPQISREYAQQLEFM